MTSIQQPKSLKAVSNQITSLFMAELDSRTGLWFPIKKMTWKEKQNNNYLDCSIHFIKGAQIYQSLYPERKNLFVPKDLSRTMKYKDILKSAWRNRMPVARPLEEELKICMGFNSEDSIDPVKFVARDGGYRHGDLCGLFPEITPDERGNYNFVFRGVDTWTMCTNNKPELETISTGANITVKLPEKEKVMPGEWEKPMLEPPPETIRTTMYAENEMVGYAPHYIQKLYQQFREQLQIKVFQVNSGVPFEYQFLFLATVNQKAGIPFSDEIFQLLNQ
ncbi:hypothetical protein I4641_02355 [Waterburya agarophytonicola K14]|uniref:Uncharacterized protein n=1 Tax=Waterburya agarophytonicola KI4 TaxID=2874699 RepID=A0A964BNX6_9CYAN|nr:hypothetical protein [Waterburya agarophytonicola]MCC0175823.1 hypothetical protein [Waterburya agarophytonicola KI4]